MKRSSDVVERSPGGGFFKPTGYNVLRLVEVWDVGLDIQQRGAIQDVNLPEKEGGALDTFQPDDRQPDGVRTGGGTRGENAVGSGHPETGSR